jgi:serine/threonine protein kinase/formylglycine-generating enzyme required for sulfatase activity
MTPNGPADARSHAEALFAEYLRRREHGEELALETFAREHPENEADLVRLAKNWDRVGGVIGRLAGSDSDATLRAAEPGPTPIEVCDRLTKRRTMFERYRVEGEIARGGMGTVLRAWDADLRRHVAMKVVLEGQDAAKESDGSGRMRRLSRFLDEAQITGQLDHPGIVPVHELGLDEKGRLFFTLKLVRGRDLRAIFELVREGAEGWSQTRALGVLLRVCEAMSFAHERGVIHRDLKPANVMVGRHGETYVMDWGLARVFGEEDLHDLRIREPASAQSLVHSDRKDAADETPDSPLMTMDGDILGTPQYMPPEQASGDRERIGPGADVYATGAMLYELLSGQAPYLRGSARVSPQIIWRWVMDSAPQPLAKLAPDQPPELVAICEKAMAREIDERYPDMSALADDLRAFLEHRVVRAWRTGPIVELRKWVERNRIAACLLGLLVLLAVGAGYGWAWQERVRQLRQRELLVHNARLHVEQAQHGWRIHPDSVPAMQSWLESAGDLVTSLPGLIRERDELRAHGRPLRDDEWEARLQEHPLRQSITRERESILTRENRLKNALDLDSAGRAVVAAELEGAKLRLAELERQFHEIPWHFDDADIEAKHERVAKTVADLRDLALPDTGWIAKTDRALKQALAMMHRTPEEDRLWTEAKRSIREDCPLYEGMDLHPQVGLVPLGPCQGLWEFWHVLSGAHPKVDEDGQWVIGPETGMVLLLVPGRETDIGAQSTDKGGPNYDPASHDDKNPLREVDLDPYFLSKYELTQGQWERLAGDRPSTFCAGQDYREAPPITASHPVESIGWQETLDHLATWGLRIPTEAQWEFAARAGEPGPFGAFATFEEIPPERNLVGFSEHDPWFFHGPVDRMEQNVWGFFGMFGNVSEWTFDWTNQSPRPDEGTPQPGTGEVMLQYSSMHTWRGPSYRTSGELLVHPYVRNNAERDSETCTVGIRPSRRLD